MENLPDILSSSVSMAQSVRVHARSLCSAMHHVEAQKAVKLTSKDADSVLIICLGACFRSDRCLCAESNRLWSC